MSLGAEIIGIEELKRKLGAELVDKVAAEAIQVGIFNGVEAVKADAKEFISNSENKLTAEQREAAQEVGAVRTGENQLQVQTGRLQNSIMSAVDKDGTGAVYTNVEYARIHELGGFTGRNGKTLIPARPYLLPALTKNVQKTLDFIKGEFIARLKQIGAK